MEVRILMREIGFSDTDSDIVCQEIKCSDGYPCRHEIYGDRATDLFRYYASEPIHLLGLYLVLATESYPRFKNAGWSDRVYFDSMRDIYIWACDYRTRNHAWGLSKPEWVVRSLNLEVIRLGRLQFEPLSSGGLNVHIPRDGRLMPALCDSAFEEAAASFPEVQKCYCRSWLLSPLLRTFLSAESNIIKFQKRFRIVDFKLIGHQAEERVFGWDWSDLVQYPEDTVLQRALKKYLQTSGDTVGVGIGELELR